MQDSSLELKRSLVKINAHLKNIKTHLRSILENHSEIEMEKQFTFPGFRSHKKISKVPFSVKFEVPSKTSAIELRFVGKIPTKRNATLATIEYFNQNGEPISGPYEGCSTSSAVGEYIYLKPNSDGIAKLSISLPDGAKYLNLGIRLWGDQRKYYLSRTFTVRWIINESTLTEIKKAFWHVNSISTVSQKISDIEVNRGRTVLSALDEISHLNLSRQFNLEKLDRADYQTQIISENPSFMLLESAWKANDGDWEYAFLSPGLRHANAKAMVDAMEVAKSNDVPIVFWNKEDPLHYDKFLPIAQKADIILTTDVNCINKYKRDTTAKTQVMPFAANLAVTNPIGRYLEPNDSVCFAGGWYSVGHEERTRQMNYMLQPILDFGGVIYDRHSVQNSDRYAFPDKFKKHIRPAVKFDEMIKLYRRFKVFLNVNTIIDSETMMSRRVYELLASGTPVVSAPSAAIESQFEGIVRTATTAKQASEEVGNLLSDDVLWRKTSHRGIREIVKNHQYKHRARIINQMVFGQQNEEKEPLVSIIMSTKRQQFVDRIIENISRQRNVNFEVHFALGHAWSDENINKLDSLANMNPFLKRVTISRHDNTELLGDKLNALIKRSKGDFISKFDDDDFYFENYLFDTVQAFDLGGFDVVGKCSHPVYMEGRDEIIWREPHKRSVMSDFISGPTITARREVFRTFPFASLGKGEDSSFLAAAKMGGCRIYSSDEFNFIQYRSASTDHHTWNVDEDVFKRMGAVVGSRDSFKDWIV